MATPIVRPSGMALAFVNAATKAAEFVRKADETNWVTRRVIGNMDRENFGIIKEPSHNAHLSYRTAQQLKAKGVL